MFVMRRIIEIYLEVMTEMSAVSRGPIITGVAQTAVDPAVVSLAAVLSPSGAAGAFSQVCQER